MYYPMNYQQQPTFQPFPQLMQNQRTDVVRVNGRNGAEAYAMGANSSALLLDESGTLVWLVTTDGAGYKTIAPYDITPHKAAEAPDFASLEARIMFIGRTVWYWVKEDNKVYKCQYAATGEYSPANGEVKDVVEYNGKHYVRCGKSWTRLD